jgi:hypothetical protein
LEQPDLLRRVIGILEELKIPYMVVGSIASGAYGEPRLTQDIDVVVELDCDRAEALCAAFPLPEYYVSPEAAGNAIRYGGQFNVIHPTSGNKIDFMVAGRDDWARSQLARRRRVKILPDRDGVLSAPEDIIISKMRYYRRSGHEKHLRDITGILKVSGDEVDRAYVARWAEEFGLTEIWEALLRRIGERPPGAPA